MADLKGLLNEEIECQIQALGSMETGSEEKTHAIADLDKMYKLHIEETKVELDHQRETAKMTEDKIRWAIGTGITIIGGVGMFVCKNFWLKEGFKFETTGTFGGSMNKQFVLPFIKFKK